MRLDLANQPVPLKVALDVIQQVGKQKKLQRKQIDALAAYVSEFPTDDQGRVPRDQLVGVLYNLKDALRLSDPSILTEPRGFWWPRVPDVIEAAESSEYLNKKRILWDSTKDNLWQIHHNTAVENGPWFWRYQTTGSPPCIINLSGSQGGGKSETTILSAAYTLMLCLMMHNAHLEFEQDPGSWMIFALQGLKVNTTKDSLFDKLKYAVDNSPWFQEFAPRRADFNAELQWPEHHIKVVNLTGLYDAGLGKDIFFAGLTEVNEMPVLERSKRLKDTDKTVLDIGKEMFDVISNRIETRFSQMGGGFPGKLIVDSARASRQDFTSKLKERAKSDPNILIVEKPLWVAKAHKYPAHEPKFLVERSDGKRPPRIIASMDMALDPGLVIKVPQRHRSRFESNVEDALKYFVGDPPCATGKFIPFPEAITRAQELYVERFGDLRPFLYPEISIRDMFGELKKNRPIDWSLLINYKYFEQILDKSVAFTAHVDMSTSGDATGVAFARVIGAKAVTHAQLWNAEQSHLQEFRNIEAPLYIVDGILRIVARPGEIIDPSFVQALLLELKRLINLRYASADWFESWQMLLNLKKEGIVADKYSVDSKPDGYFEYRSALKEERVILCPHVTNDEESRQLMRSIVNGKVKVNHPDGGSKDCSDGVAGCLGVLFVTEGQRYLNDLDAHKVENDDDDWEFGRDDDDDDEKNADEDDDDSARYEEDQERPSTRYRSGRSYSGRGRGFG